RREHARRNLQSLDEAQRRDAAHGGRPRDLRGACRRPVAHLRPGRGAGDGATIFLVLREADMRRAIEHYAAGDWPKANATDSLTLVFDDRHRRRIRLASDGGAPVLLDLKRTAAMGDGDGLYCDDGAWLAVCAAP